jgi:hypothetical protein
MIIGDLGRVIEILLLRQITSVKVALLHIVTALYILNKPISRANRVIENNIMKLARTAEMRYGQIDFHRNSADGIG